MPFIERLVLGIGCTLLAFSFYEALVGRAPEAFLATGLTMVVLALFRGQIRHLKVGPGGIDMTVHEISAVKQQLVAEQQAPDLKLLISTGIPVGMAETIMGSDHVVQLTVVNTGARPIGVKSLGLDISNGRWIPFPESLPTEGNIRLPAVLEPQQAASVWMDRNKLRDWLRAERVRPTAIVAKLVDGTSRSEPVPGDWAHLGDDE